MPLPLFQDPLGLHRIQIKGHRLACQCWSKFFLLPFHVNPFCCCCSFVCLFFTIISVCGDALLGIYICSNPSILFKSLKVILCFWPSFLPAAIWATTDLGQFIMQFMSETFHPSWTGCWSWPHFRNLKISANSKTWNLAWSCEILPLFHLFFEIRGSISFTMLAILVQK